MTETFWQQYGHIDSIKNYFKWNKMARVIKQHKFFWLLVCGVIVLGGCSSRDLYNAAQQNRLQECSKLYGAQREECEARYQKDFDTYQREREEVLNDDN